MPRKFIHLHIDMLLCKGPVSCTNLLGKISLTCYIIVKLFLIFLISIVLPQAHHTFLKKKKVYYSGQVDFLLHQDYHSGWFDLTGIVFAMASPLLNFQCFHFSLEIWRFKRNATTKISLNLLLNPFIIC